MSSSVTAAPSSGSSAATSAGSSTLSIPQTAALGGITITQPAQTAQASYYKIAPDNFVTIGWNFTAVLAQPTSLTVVASASGGNTYAISTLPGTATNIVWCPYSVEQTGTLPLAVATYTLSIWDERGPKATQAAGRMSVYSGLSFALYRPQGYTPLSSWTCATCSGASAVFKTPGFLLLFATLLTMALSGWGLLVAGPRRRAGPAL